MNLIGAEPEAQVILSLTSIFLGVQRPKLPSLEGSGVAPGGSGGSSPFRAALTPRGAAGALGMGGHGSEPQRASAFNDFHVLRFLW